MRNLLAVTMTALAVSSILNARTLEKVPLGDFEQWTVRYIHESDIIGGETRVVYAIAPTDTIRTNTAFSGKNTIWGTSNAFAKVMGVVKTSVSCTPDDGPSGKCAKLENCWASCRVAGMFNIKVLVAGSIFWGRCSEPVTSTADPYGNMDWGIPFTRKPEAVVFDYRSVVSGDGVLTKGTTTSNKTFPGDDWCEAMLILQNRWEDEKGNIHAKRVGTAFLRIKKTSDGWVRQMRMPVIYGDASEDASFESYMGLTDRYYGINSRGRKKPIVEEGWGGASDPVTHALMKFSSGCHEAFVGGLGNVLWVDNVMLEY